jgi:hypothetical protein
MAEDRVTFELKEPASPELLLPHDYSTAGWVSAAILALGLLGAGLLWWRRCHPSAPAQAAARNLAYSEASGGLARIAATQARDAAVQASLILRKYLSLAVNDPALFETHEEFIARHDALSALTDSARNACESGFASLAALKYAPQIPDLAPAAVVSEARALLETLHHAFHA